MGYKRGSEVRTDGNFSDTWFAPDGNNYVYLKFTTDWNWLIPVIIQIGSEAFFPMPTMDVPSSIGNTVQRVVNYITKVNSHAPRRLEWVEVNESTPWPKSEDEFLTRNDNQGGTLKLVSWRVSTGSYVSKGQYVSHANLGTHYLMLPPA